MPNGRRVRVAKVLARLCLVGLGLLPAGRAVGQGERKLSAEALIDQLVNLRTHAWTQVDLSFSDSFLAEEQDIDRGPGAPHTPPAIRELVRRGPAVLPQLLAHLTDARATHVLLGDTAKKGTRHLLGENWYRSTAFGEEYDPRVHVPPAPRKPFEFSPIPYYPERPFRGAYVMKVGDVCYGLIGQIVARYLMPMTEHEDIAMDVNSPLEASVLAAKTREDWGQGDPAALLKASLLEDVRLDRYQNNAMFALVRLRFYFPETYRGLTGAELEKRRAFERDEAVMRSNR